LRGSPRPPAWKPPATDEYAADPVPAVLERYAQVRDLTEGAQH
jgi:xylulokinase